MTNHEDDLDVGLNMSHPWNSAMMDFISNSTPSMVDAFFARLSRRCVFEAAMDEIGGLSKFRRKIVVRSLVRMFRAGYFAGRASVRDREATDGTHP